MCTELFLAIIYFSTIFTVNFFLFKLLKTYTKNIIYLLKVQNIFKQKNTELVRGFILLHLYKKKNGKNLNLLPLLLFESSSTTFIDSLFESSEP